MGRAVVVIAVGLGGVVGVIGRCRCCFEINRGDVSMDGADGIDKCGNGIVYGVQDYFITVK